MVDRLELERRIAIAALVATCLSTVMWLTAITTNDWCSVTFDKWSALLPDKRYVKGYNMGLWTLCAHLYFNATNTSDATGPVTKCKPLTTTADDNDPRDQTLTHYRRSARAMGIITMLLCPLAIGFGAYSIQQARYMFKRVASVMHLITAATAMVSIEVFRAMVYKMNEWVKGYNWFLGKFQYGFSCAFAWVTFILLVLSGLAFLATSRKRKREKALSEREARENEPVHLGR